ncbi:MAG: hypothetical protein O3A46_11170 [Candidatus Poribacteria bacterium]|nr:hypothetical protein [Candidatus Poribacteria bacterium]
MSMSTIGIWVAAILTLCLYSFLYRDNPFYKFAEHLFVGIAQGYWTTQVYFNGFIPYVWNPLAQGFGIGQPAQWFELTVFIPIGLGMLFFAQFIKGYRWLTRIPLAFLFGAASGISIPLVMGASIFQQMNATITPFGSTTGVVAYLNLLLIVIGLLTGLTYFFFSVEHRGTVGIASRIGIWFLMVGFGAAFGNTIMNRVYLLIQRVEFLLNDWVIGTIFS